MIYNNINGPAMDQLQISTYLNKIDMPEPNHKNNGTDPGLDYLKKLQFAHMSHIPYSNLDTMQGIASSLDRTKLFDKLIYNGRGGLCSELNTLYNWLLESLGYNVVSYMSRITSSKAKYQAPSHRIMGVNINNQTYITDVGYNYEHHRIPLLLQDNLEQYDGECTYCLKRDEFWGWAMWQCRGELGWRQKLGFTENHHIDVDFVPATFYAEFHPDSFINKATKISSYIDGVFHAIRGGNYLTEHNGIEEVIEPILSVEQENAIIEDIFGLTPCKPE